MVRSNAYGKPMTSSTSVRVNIGASKVDCIYARLAVRGTSAIGWIMWSGRRMVASHVMVDSI